ncbi:transketolase [Neocallimastix lanati (nom. inval.)]|jgi:transketolase|nr:transketolase [Neocallimastix sp. JGI-2020a]
MLDPFTEVDKRAINIIRAVSCDMIDKANSGHPGAAMDCAPMAHVLFSRFIKCNPTNSKWINRDRFVLSNGHACALQYIINYLLGYKISLNDLKNFRQYSSNTPGHPERGITDGIEVTSGPLGQGFSNAVGLAIAQAHLAAVYNRPGFELFNNYTYTIVGDGCLQEGVASEAASMAGHYKLGKLIAFYDANNVQIDGKICVQFSEDVCSRFQAYGWQVLKVDDGDNDLSAIANAIEEAQNETKKPTLIYVHTTIGYGSNVQGTSKAHGTPLKDETANVKRFFGLDPTKKFDIPDDVRTFYADITKKGINYEKQWNSLFGKYSLQYPEEAKEIRRRLRGQLTKGWENLLPRYTPADKPAATRKLSETVLNSICDALPEFIGGSADLTGSNLTRWKTAKDFQADGSGLGGYDGRYFHYGVREHGMAAVMNGISAYGCGFIPFGSTFLNFIGYASGAVRLSSLSKHQVIYIMTHDSIGVGEDGSTHQPIETLASLRAQPNINVIRPADGNEVSAAYLQALTSKNTPSVLCFSRQSVPHLQGSSIEKALKGGYILQDEPNPKIVLAGTGSEVSLCVEAAKILKKEDISCRVVSLPCLSQFDAQGRGYRNIVLPKGIPVLSVEAASTFGWAKYAHMSIGIDNYGMSAPAKKIFEHFGLVPEVVAKKAKFLISEFPKLLF